MTHDIDLQAAAACGQNREVPSNEEETIDKRLSQSSRHQSSGYQKSINEEYKKSELMLMRRATASV